MYSWGICLMSGSTSPFFLLDWASGRCSQWLTSTGGECVVVFSRSANFQMSSWTSNRRTLLLHTPISGMVCSLSALYRRNSVNAKLFIGLLRCEGTSHDSGRPGHSQLLLPMDCTYSITDVLPISYAVARPVRRRHTRMYRIPCWHGITALPSRCIRWGNRWTDVVRRVLDIFPIYKGDPSAHSNHTRRLSVEGEV